MRTSIVIIDQSSLFMPTLDSLNEGDIALIKDINGDDAVSVRLMEMGLLEGEEIRVIGSAPLGDPIEYEIRGYRLSLRKAEAQRVDIEQIDEGQ